MNSCRAQIEFLNFSQCPVVPRLACAQKDQSQVDIDYPKPQSDQ